MRNPDRHKAQEKQLLTNNLDDNVAFLKDALGIGKSFDVIHRELMFAGRRFGLFFVDGLAKDDIMNVITIHLAKLEWGDLAPDSVEVLLKKHIGYLEVGKVKKMDEIITAVLSGPLVLVIEGQDEALMIDARTYPARGPDEPDIERVVRGPRDGFTETIVFNTALTRRRVRDPSLRMEPIQIGKRSKTDVVISYLEDVADEGLVNEIRERLKNIEIDGLPMAEKTIEEFILGNHWNPFPLVRYTERPDVAAIHLLEGHVLIYTDTSPSVMITPATLFHHVQHAEEYRQKPIVGAYLRWVRFAAMLSSVFLLPLWLLVTFEPHLLPDNLQYIGPNHKGHVPLMVQILIAEVGIDVLRMAAIHTPNSLATALGLVAALMIGQVAVEVGLFSNEVILYLAFAAIGTFATPSYEFSLATRIVRLTLVLAVGFFHTIGFVVMSVAWFILLLFTKSLNTPYLWPLIPLNFRALMDVIIRSPMPAKDVRPAILNPEDPTRE